MTWEDEARARANAATPGPWTHERRFGKVPASVVHAPPGVLRGQRRDLPVSEDLFGRDAEFIAHARTDLPRALDVIAAVRALHQPDNDRHRYVCTHCIEPSATGGEQVDWPCDTIRALDWHATTAGPGETRGGVGDQGGGPS